MGRKSYIDEDGELRELDAEWFARAKLGRPPLPSEQLKRQISIRLDPDVLEYYRGTGRGWQTRINEALRKAMK